MLNYLIDLDYFDWNVTFTCDFDLEFFCSRLYGSSQAYYASDLRKEGGVIYSFTHLFGGLFIADIWPCKSWKHGQSFQITGEGLKSYIQ